MGLSAIMLGAPGAGKGTQAERFARQRGLPRISTGGIPRQGVEDQLPVALVAKAKMDRGELVDDETMVTIVRERLVLAQELRATIDVVADRTRVIVEAIGATAR